MRDMLDFIFDHCQRIPRTRHRCQKIPRTRLDMTPWYAWHVGFHIGPLSENSTDWTMCHDMIHSCVWLNLYTCDMSHSYVSTCDHCQRIPRTRLCAMTWFTHTFDTTSTCVTCLIHTFPHVTIVREFHELACVPWHDSLKRVTRPLAMCDMTNSYVSTSETNPLAYNTYVSYASAFVSDDTYVWYASGFV